MIKPHGRIAERDDPEDECSEEEWFRLCSAPVTYRYDCYINPFCGFACTAFVGLATAIEFPVLESALGGPG